MLETFLEPFSAITLKEVLVFTIPFIAAIFIDLASHKSHKPITLQNALLWSCIWVACGLLFAVYILKHRGGEAASLYITGYLLEKALAVDNLFAFYLIFKSFGLNREDRQFHQHRILYWGILGAIVFRLFFLGLGAIIVNMSSYVLVFFALIVLWTVWKMWTSSGSHEEVDYGNHWSVNMVKRVAPVNPSIESGHFFFHGVTPLFLCLICIEMCDLVFAFDSMPVIIAVVKDPYLMITSCLWAVAGLRSLYFLLVAAQNVFWALDKAVMVLLVFVAAKLMLAGLFHYHLPNAVSLSIIGLVLGTGIAWSLIFKPPGEEKNHVVDKKDEDQVKDS